MSAAIFVDQDFVPVPEDQATMGVLFRKDGPPVFVAPNLAAKAYDPDQPRWPEGDPRGGQWRPEDGGAPAGEAGQGAVKPMTGPEVRQILEDLQNYRADEVAELREEAKRRGAALVAEYERQLAEGLTENEPAQKAIAHLQYRVQQANDQIYEIEKDRLEKRRQWIEADKPGAVAMEFADAITDQQREKIIAAFDQFNALVGPKATGEILVTPNKNGRSRYVEGDGSGREAGKPEMSIAGGLRSVIHELGHHFEHTAPGVMERAIAFWRNRTEFDVPVPLKTLVPDSGYSPKEMTSPDFFFDPYVGKVYRDANNNVNATEIVSMGIEAMWADPLKFARSDPEHFDLIWDLMRSRP